MTNGYKEIYGTVASQRKQIEEQRQQFRKPVVSGTAKQRRIAMRQVRKTPEYQRYVKEKRKRLTVLGEAETEIGEYESKIREYEKKGYEAERKDGEIRFTKRVYVPGERVLVQREQSVLVSWVNPKTGQTGRVQTTNLRYDATTRQLEERGRTVTKVTTVGGGPQYQTTGGYWTTEDVEIAKAPLIVTQPEKTKKIIEVYTLQYEKYPPGIQKRMIHPSKFAERFGVSEYKYTMETIPAKIKETIIIPPRKEVDLLSWSKQEMKKIQRAYKVHPVLGFTAELGFGITSSFASLGKLGATYFAPKLKEVHYVSPFDIVFTPLGWAPKEAPVFLEKYLVFRLGGTVGEVAQVAAFYGVGQAVKIGVVAGTKVVVRKAPLVVGKLKVFTGIPKYTFKIQTLALEKGVKTIVTRKPTVTTQVFGKIEQIRYTQFWRDIQLYAKGKGAFYKAYPIVKGYPKVYREGELYAKISKYRGFGRTVLELKKVGEREQVGRTLTTFLRGQPGEGLRHVILYERVYKPKRVFPYLFRKEVKKVYVSFTKGATYQKIIEPTGGEFIRPFVSKELKRIPYIATKPSFISATEAAARLVPTTTVPSTVSTMGRRMGAGMVGREALLVPYSLLPAKAPLLVPLTISGVRVMSLSEQEKLGVLTHKTIQQSIQKRDLSFKQVMDIEKISISLPSYMQITPQIERTLQKQQQKQMQAYKLMTKQIYQPPKETVTRIISRAAVQVKPSPFIPWGLPDEGVKRKKRKKKKEVDELFKGYRFRRWKVPTMRQIIGMEV